MPHIYSHSKQFVLLTQTKCKEFLYIKTGIYKGALKELQTPLIM